MSQIPGRWSASRSLILPFILALGILLLTAACMSEDDPTPETVIPATATPTWTPIPAATSAPAPTATPTAPPAIPTPTETDDDDETQAVIPSEMRTYTDDLYGYALQVPETWTDERLDRNPLGVVTTFDTGNEDITVQTIVLFREEPVDTYDFALDQLTPLAGLSAFNREGDPKAFALGDGSDGHRVFYLYGTGSNEVRGVISVVARGTMAMGIHIVAPRTTYERNFYVLDPVSTSIRPVMPQPFGAPRDDTLVLLLDSGPLTLDPGISAEVGSAQYIRQIFSGLVRLNANLIPEPDLATWEVSEDGTVYTFTIRDGAQFHNGTPITAQDVIFSWERALNRNLPPVGGSAASYLDDIVGAKEYSAGEADSVTGLEATDDSTLVVTIDEAKSYFISKLSHTAAYVVLQSNVPEVPSPRVTDDDEGVQQSASQSQDADAEGEDDDVKPPLPWYYSAIGSGPYKLAEYARGRAAHLTAFENYVGGAPPIGNLVFRFHAGFPTLMIEEGFIDATTLIGIGDYESLVEEESSLVDNITHTDKLSIHYLAFNTTIEPFDDPDVRRAFLWAVDRRGIYEEILGDADNVAEGFMPPGLPGYDEDIAEIPYDPVAAKELFDDTDFGRMEEQPAIVIATGGNLTRIQRAILAAWQENLGVRIVYRRVGPTYSYVLSSLIANTESPTHIYTSGWIADYPDPHNFLNDLFHTESPNNDGKAGSEAIDELLEEARTAGEDRLEQYRAIEQRLVQEAVAVPLWFDFEYVLVVDRVSNLTMDAQGFLRLENVELEP